MHFVSIDAGAQVAIILLACGPYVVIVNCWDRFCTLGRALGTKETLPDFCEWCRVTRHSRVFRGLTGYQRTPEFWGVTAISLIKMKFESLNYGEGIRMSGLKLGNTKAKPKRLYSRCRR